MMEWKRGIAGVAMAGIVLATAIGARAVETKSGPAQVQRSRLVTLTATVEAIDLDKHRVTLKGSKGNVVVLEVGDQVKNLPQLKVGDQVTAKYYQGIAMRVVPPGQAAPPPSKTETLATAPTGEKPGAVRGEEITRTVTIEAINQKAGTVTFKDPEGNSQTVKAQDPKNLTLIKAGDQVEITYTEALAISVAEAPKKSS